MVASGLVVVLLAGSLPGQERDRALRVISPERKLALVIGNEAYRDQWALANPVRDARAVAGALRNELGFDEVLMLTDIATDEEMKVAVEDFGKRLGPNDLALFYYSGHGMQVEKRNFLLPTGFDSRTERRFVPHRTLPQEEVVTALQAARLSVLVLDACRNNPYARGGGGWAHEQPRPEKGKGMLIAYATDEGDTASDRGFYAERLVAKLKQPGLEVRELFQQVKEEVNELTDGDQRPQHYPDIIGDYFFVPDNDVLSSSPPPGGDCESYWSDVRGTEDAGEYEWFLKQCPGGAYSELARMRLARLRLPPPLTLDTDDPPGTTGAATGGRTGRAAADREWENSLGMEFVRVPAGEFSMGSDSEHAADVESPVTRVRISAGYWMGKHEVTQGEWQAVMGENPSASANCGSDCPVERVSWEDVQEYIRKLNTRERGGGYSYRLPTEAEWEYAARAGTRTDTPAGDLRILGHNNAPLLDEIAWYGGNSGVSYAGGVDCSGWAETQYSLSRCGPQPVGRKAPNAWGLHDMLGNVYEWVQDWRGDYPGGSVTDPAGPATGSYRVARGGGWSSIARYCRSAYRRIVAPGFRSNHLGFRLLRTE
ncbi:MAG: SUMF1/EgtB/PvdO family nonheme iron enzyme [Bryobacterales bacterium]|nr:SUMF1/EgtB/PvdO family nonheme iron enzyme [Bryobacterales bacterium]